MKANELMIGDWVYINANYAKGKPLRVLAAHGDGYAGPGATVVFPEPDGDEVSFPEKDIVPIPLTYDILYKNGWDIRQLTGVKTAVLKIDTKYFPVWLEWRAANKTLFIGDGLVPTPVEYVHQIQHALRLCGIEKDIEL